MTSPPIKRRTLAGLSAAVLVGSSCSPDPSTPTPPPNTGSSTASSSTESPTAQPSSPSPTPTPGQDPDWVTTENSLPGSREWRIKGTPADEDEMAGFASTASALPGDQVVLKVTCTAPTWTVRAFRLGWYGGVGARLVFESEPVSATRQPPVKVDESGMVTASHWSPSLALDTTGWPPGSYLLLLTSQAGRQKYIPLTIRSTTFDGTVLIVSATTTYQAYNTYGGRSLYEGPDGSFGTRARKVSFDRPYDSHGARHAYGYERQIIAVAEKLGVRLSYATSFDLEAGQAAFTGLRGLVSTGHDEYWSVPMRRCVEHLRDTGTNVAFLGANALYWRVRFEQQGRVVVGYKSAAEDPVTNDGFTDLWRIGEPESGLTGMLYECFPVTGAMVVTDPDFFLFDGTGARQGSNYPGLLGVEVDRAYPSPLAPATLRVVAHSPVQCGDVGPTHADVTYYTVDSGAGVFSVGTMNWAWGLDEKPHPGTELTEQSLAFAKQVTANLLTAMAAGPMGRNHPAVSNLDAIEPSSSTRTGTGLAVRSRS